MLITIMRDIRRHGDYILDTTETMPHLHDLDLCDRHARHCGGAFHVAPVVEYYDRNGYTDDRILRIEKEVLGDS